MIYWCDMKTETVNNTNEARSVRRVVRWLCVPTKPAPTWIPLGMAMEDFELLKASLELWSDRIVASPKEEPANVRVSNCAEENPTK